MANITNEEKLEALKSWLKVNDIEFVENYLRRCKLKIRLWIPKLRIAVNIGDDREFYKNTFKWCKPFFIRESETKEFIIEKIENCAYDQFVLMQKLWERRQSIKNIPTVLKRKKQ